MANANFTCTLEAWASGSTIYANMHYYRTDGLTYTYQDTSFPAPTMTIAGTSFSDTDFANRVHSGIGVGNVYTTQFSKTVGANGTYAVSFSAGSGLRSDFAGSWSTNVTVTGAATAPSGGYVNGVTSYWDTGANEIRVHTTGAGVANTGGASLTGLNWVACEAPYVSGIARRSIALPSNGAASTLSNSLSTWSGNTIDMAPNKQLYLVVYAANSAGGYHYQWGSLITPPAPASVANTGVTATEARFSYSVSSDGGVYDKQIQYSLDGGATWVTATTVTGGAAATGTFVINNLTDNTSYALKCRVSTSAGETNSPDIAFTTLKASRFYGSASGQAERIIGFYGSVNGQTKKITKLYGSANGQSKLIYQDFGHLQ